jgi:hypothetical protein
MTSYNMLIMSAISFFILLSNSSVSAAHKENKKRTQNKIVDKRHGSRNRNCPPGQQEPGKPWKRHQLQKVAGTTSGTGHNSLIFTAESFIQGNYNPSLVNILPIAGNPSSNNFTAWRLNQTNNEINLTFNIPMDFDPSEQPVVTIYFVTDTNGGIATTGAITLSLYSIFAPQNGSVVNALFNFDGVRAQPVTTATTKNTYNSFDTSFSLSPVSDNILAGSFAFLTFYRGLSGDTYAAPVFVTSIEFRYLVLS